MDLARLAEEMPRMAAKLAEMMTEEAIPTMEDCGLTLMQAQPSVASPFTPRTTVARSSCASPSRRRRRTKMPMYDCLRPSCTECRIFRTGLSDAQIQARWETHLARMAALPPRADDPGLDADVAAAEARIVAQTRLPLGAAA